MKILNNKLVYLEVSPHLQINHNHKVYLRTDKLKLHNNFNGISLVRNSYTFENV